MSGFHVRLARLFKSGLQTNTVANTSTIPGKRRKYRNANIHRNDLFLFITTTICLTWYKTVDMKNCELNLVFKLAKPDAHLVMLRNITMNDRNITQTNAKIGNTQKHTSKNVVGKMYDKNHHRCSFCLYHFGQQFIL